MVGMEEERSLPNDDSRWMRSSFNNDVPSHMYAYRAVQRGWMVHHAQCKVIDGV